MLARKPDLLRPCAAGAALMLAAALSGCSLAPRYERPPSPVAATYPAPPAGFRRCRPKPIALRPT